MLEKAREPGAHLLSGAVLDPRALAELIPDFEARGAPLASRVHDDRVLFLTRSGQDQFPFTPPPLRNHGNFIISLQQFGNWLSGLVEAEGVDVFCGFAATELLMDGERVIGVRTGDRGIDRHGDRKPSFEPGVDIHAKVTILADGVRGNLTKELLRRVPLAAGKQPQLFSLGIKELWDVPAGRLAAGSVIHTMGYPLRQEEFGGGFIYAMSDTRLSIGFVAGLDYRDPMFDPHVAFQQFKLHPFVKSLLQDGQMIRYGAKALPGRRLARAAGMRGGRRADRRRCRRLSELSAPEGHSSGDEDRHAGRRNGVRRRHERRHVRRPGSGSSTRRFAAAGSPRNCVRFAMPTRASSTACLRASRFPACRC